MEHKVDLNRFALELELIKKKKKKDNCILFYGSSTFALWKDIEDIFPNAINAGFGGSTSDEALYHYETVAKPFNASVLVWYYGDNEPVCGYSILETKNLFLSTWKKFLNDNKNIKIITIATKTCPTRDEYAMFINELNGWQKQMAKDNDYLAYIETNDLCKDSKNNYRLEAFKDDKLHFSSKSYAIIKERIEKELKKI